MGCIFCDIINRKAPAEIVYEDESLVAFKDISPQAPCHILLIPREHIPTVDEASAEIMGKLMKRAAMLAKEQGVSEKGFRIVVNCRRHAGQSVYHLHFHLLGGRWFSWPPG